GKGQLQGTFVNNEPTDDTLVCIAATAAKPARAGSPPMPYPTPGAAETGEKRVPGQGHAGGNPLRSHPVRRVRYPVSQ
ncbi:hypothetical protein, partial [Streptomyces sp. NPDC056144]|uniref:hypothetical protein n=1 Tax=Streptomyces sp. NPDC056144 TaxID=3345726 RepID=UPI0035D854AF